MPTKNIIATVRQKGDIALSNTTNADTDVELKLGATPHVLDEGDLVSAVLEYAEARGILPALLKAMPQRKRRTRKKPDRKAA